MSELPHPRRESSAKAGLARPFASVALVARNATDGLRPGVRAEFR